MAEMVASRSLQVLDDLKVIDKDSSKTKVIDKDAWRRIEYKVTEMVSALTKTENLLINCHNSNEVLENMEIIRNLAYTIEDRLEVLAIGMEIVYMCSKNEKKRGIRGILKRRFGGQDDGRAMLKLVVELVTILTSQEEYKMKWLHDTFPDEDLKQLISLVAEKRVVSICGVKGLGNTNLARKVYIHPQVRSSFNAFAWVSLSQDYQIGNLLQNMLNQLGAEAVKMSAEEQKKGAEEKEKGAGGNLLQNMILCARAVKKITEEHKKGEEEERKKGSGENMIDRVEEGAEEQPKSSEENMIDQLKEIQRQKSCFIVIDGISETSQWTDISSAFQIGGTHTSILLTTDDETTIAGVGVPYQLSLLNEDVLESERSVVIDHLPRQMYGMEEHFVRSNDLEQLISLVDKNRAISIWGVKGLGKTTLARKVYFHPQVRSSFNAFAWVSLRHDDKIENLLQNMLNQLGAGAAKMSVEENKKGTEDYPMGNLLQSIKKLDAGAVKKSAGEKKKGVEVKKEGEEEQKKGAEEKKKGVEVKKEGAGAVTKSAEEKKKGVEVKKEGAEEMKEGAEEQPKSREENIIDQLKEIQRQKSCFIVIDGNLEIGQWEHIRSVFLEEGTATKILLTTQDEIKIADVVSYELKPLSEDEGWELLQKHVFGGKKAPELGIVPKLGKEMLGKCKGLPLKISSLGRTLSKMPSSEWHKVNDDVEGYLQRDQSQSNERSVEVPFPSYDKLPNYHLKQCFLYLAIFKENEDVDSEDLKFLWMAEGMVPPQQQATMDTAEYYLQELADKDMFLVQVDELSANGRFKRLCLPNHLRELSLYLGEKEGFRLKVVDFSDGKQPMLDSFSLYDGTRRLVIHFNKLSPPWGDDDLNATFDLRSLFFLNSDPEYVDLPVRISDFKEFTLLRVVHFVRCKFEGRKLPEGIDKLVNLRYFGLLYCDLDKLPSSISNFRNLHVLNVRSYDDAKITIPNVLSQMIRLKHLCLPHYWDCEQQSDKLILDGLLDLETLVGFNVDIHDIDSLSKLEKLRHLATHAYSNYSLKSIIDKLSKLVKSDGARVQTSLFIEHTCDFTSPEGLTILQEVLMCPNLDALTFSMVFIHNFPNCGTQASSHISQIKLKGCKLGVDPVEALGRFPNLRKLCLGYGAFVGRKMAIHVKGFPELEYLEFRCLPNLEEWSVDTGAMKKLSTLAVRRCPKLKEIPEGLASVYSLKNLEIELAPSALAEGREEKYNKMFHFVKSLTIRKLDPLSAGNDSAH